MLGHQIRQHRNRTLLTRQQLSERCDLSVDAIKNIEKDRGTIKALESVLCGLHIQITGIPQATTTGERIRLLRQRRNHSQRRTAELSGLTQASVVNLERGNGRVTSFYKIIDCYNIKLSIRDHKRTVFNKGETDAWNTSKDFIDCIHQIIPTFDLDPATNQTSHVKSHRGFTEAHDGLAHDWLGDFIWLNPPYSNLASWIEKAHDEFIKGHARNIIALLPARTNVGYFHRMIAQKAHVIFIEKRLKFGGANQQAPFPSMLVCWLRDDIIDDLAILVPGTLMRAAVSHF
ncbi:DNA N-6-adenine-methyltransferase [Terasakiella sp.]|uniref:DNA N-6-adenine-methyltransferase n=1 Tax=Terasakiella sp. TaxID=2034861 RepID=UPI003AA9A12D